MGKSRKQLLYAATAALTLLLFGPELGVGLEMLALLEFLGVEVFLLSLIIGLRVLPISSPLKSISDACMRIDRYYFVPTRAQLAICPGLLAHVIPGRPMSLWLLVLVLILCL